MNPHCANNVKTTEDWQIPFRCHLKITTQHSVAREDTTMSGGNKSTTVLDTFLHNISLQRKLLKTFRNYLSSNINALHTQVSNWYNLVY